MHIYIKRLILKTIKATCITIGTLIFLMILLPWLFPGVVNKKIDEWANKNINGHITFTGTHLSFFKKFPSLTLTMDNVTLMGSTPFQNDTLIAAKELELGIDLSSVFRSKINIKKILLDEAFINVQVDSLGAANYNIYKSKPTDSTAITDTNGGASLGISQIIVQNSRLIYNDQSLPMTINARGFNYTGSGDLSKDIFELNTHTEIQSLDFYYNKQPYILSKKINADLVTEINTKSLAFIFRKNNLMINQLPVEFNGRFGFIKDGYDMDFSIDSRENDVNVLISALPAYYQQLLSSTEISGTGDIQMALTGQYIAKDSIMPGISMNVKIRNGFISNQKTPSPVKNLYLDMSMKFPGFNMDSLAVNLDSLYFNIADGYLSSVVRVKGVKVPNIYASVNSEIDLEKWDRAIGLKPFHVKGKYSLHLLAEGKYATGIVTKGGLRKKVDTVITSIPKFTLQSSFKDGYFKYTSLPKAINNISFNLHAKCTDNNYKHINVAMDNIDITAITSYIKGSLKVSNLDEYPIDAALKAMIHLDDLKQIYPIDSLDLKGDLTADIKAKGTYLPAKKKYPVVAADIELKNGYVQTKYYPHPIEKIQISTSITDKTASLKGLNVSIKPITFDFEQQPFTMKAELHDFSNLDYKMNIQGKLDIGKIYKVFAKKGYDVTGTIAVNLTMKGKQSDATAHNYDKLFNKGSLKMENITCRTELYPKPFVISRGDFEFKQDRMEFDTFKVKYGHSSFMLNGTLSNIIDYIIKPGSVLTGAFNLRSKHIVIDDFMAFSDTSRSEEGTEESKSTGVILVPKNLDLDFTADVKSVKYKDIELTDTKGHLMLKNDSLLLKQMAFSLIGAPVAMDAAYTSVTPQKAYFNYHITANDFDVKKAYTNIKIFHDLASSASGAEGLISLDYELSGDLNGEMSPIYPSLKGGGVLSAKKIKMHGFKLFNAIGKEAGKDSLGGNSDVSKVAIKSKIANNIITIERTKMKVSIFRARFEGQVSFSKQLDLKFRLGLPPMGLIGIPMTITGTEDAPKIHLGKGKKEDEIQETADTDD